MTSTFRLQVHILTNHFRHRELSLLTATPSKTLFSVIFYRRLITGLHRNDIEAVIVTSKGLYQHNCVQTFPGKYRRLANIYIERGGREGRERERERERDPLKPKPRAFRLYGVQTTKEITRKYVFTLIANILTLKIKFIYLFNKFRSISSLIFLTKRPLFSSVFLSIYLPAVYLPIPPFFICAL